MPLPTTALTLHLDASDTDHIWTNWQAGSPFHNGVPTDGGTVGVWEDDGGGNFTFIPASGGVSPVWRSTTPLMQLPCLDFDGTDDAGQIFLLPSGTNLFLNSLIAASAFVIVASFYLEGASANAANVYDNDGLIADTGEYCGIHFKNASGTYSVNVYNFDGSVDTVSINLSINTSYVLAYYHTGGNISLELYSVSGQVGSTQTTASGDTQNLGNTVFIGRNYSTLFYNGRIGEIAIYNAYNSTDKADAVQYFRDKWLPAAADVLMGQIIC